MRRILLAVLVASTLGAAAPQRNPVKDIYLDMGALQRQVDSLEARVDSLEARRHSWCQYVRVDSTRTKCRAITKAGHQCKRWAAKSDTLCTQHRKATK